MKTSFVRIPALLLLLTVSLFLFAGATFAANTPDPTSVTIAGSLQDQLGCANDWDPSCAATHLAYDADDTVWQATFDVPAGNYEYKAALNNGWDENYGANAVRGGSNIPLNLGADASVKFYYDHETHWITSNKNSVIAVAPGSFQSELGCPGDWQPDCLRSWLQDPDGDGIYTFSTGALPQGSYEVKVALDESWSVNYGAGGVQNGPNIVFTVGADCQDTVFTYDSVTHVLTVGAGAAAPQPASVTIPGSFQSEVGCSDDWQADCAATHLTYDASDTVWQGTFNVPAGSWEYKAALNDSWDENYGANATRNGSNIGLNLAATTGVKFYYDHGTHWVADNQTKVIATAAGSFQSELGCPGDWQPDCLRSWLQDPDGDGIYAFTTNKLPAGNYEVKVTVNESWAENYGAGGARDGANISFSVPATCGEMTFTYDAATHILTVASGSGPKGNLNMARAYWLAEDTLAWNVPVLDGDTVLLNYAADGGLALTTEGVTGGSSLTLTKDPAGLSAELKAKFPHLAGLPAFKIAAADLPLVPGVLKGQVAVSILDAMGTLKDATALQIQGVLDDLFTYDGSLGVTFDGDVPTLSVWAPTAHSVKLHLLDDAGPTTAAAILDMTVDPATGVWSITGDASWDRKYYLFEVEVFVRATGQVETNLVTDPYSLNLSANSLRSQIVNLDDADLEPAGWDTLAKPPLAAPEDIVIYELHLRDFSIADQSVPEALRGTFGAFTIAGSNGMTHLSELADAGLTHVHLLPVFDFATVPERREDQQTVDRSLLESYPPDSEEQQALLEPIRDLDGFNWGYDPFHYTVPEGSYATTPDATARIVEFREMVQALNGAGLRVVMDVVYNHTTAAGQDARSVLDRIVPGYYHRLNADGNVETSTCCSNTATEFNMMEKLMLDSSLTWAQAYKVDGFRFDIMGHHSKANMLKLRASLDALTPANSGIDGADVYVYGEAWNFGEVANDARFVQARQANMAGTGIGSFNDRGRDGVRGGGPFSGLQEQGFINGLYTDPNATNQGTPTDQLNTLLHRTDWIRLSMAGNLADYQLVDRLGNVITGDQLDYNGQEAGYTADPQENIFYIAAHDNETLFDVNQAKLPVATTMADRVRANNLGNAIVLLSQGVPFFQAAQDMLVSKSMDRNSYNSGDWFNEIDWTGAATNWGRGLPPAGDNQSNWPIMQPLLANPAMKPGPADIQAAADSFAEFLRIRKSTGLFRLQTAEEIMARVKFYNTGPNQVPGLIVMGISDADGGIGGPYQEVVALFNADNATVKYTVPQLAGKKYVLHPVLAASSDPIVRGAAFAKGIGAFSIPARTTAVFVLVRPVEQLQVLIGDVQELVSDGTLNAGQGNALIVKLQAAIASIDRGKTQAAIGQLNAFVNQVKSFVRAGILTVDQGAALIATAQSVIATLSG